MIYSLDIFDTLLLRTEPAETTLLRLPQDFRNTRLALHREHYQSQTVDQFYQGIGEDIRQELDLESQHLIVNREILDFVTSHPDDTFVLTSDMYLNSQHLRYILGNLNVPDFYQKIFVSCEQGCSKEGFGKLFDCVAREYGNNVIHIGDNIKSDFQFGSLKLAPAIHYTPDFNSYNADHSDHEQYYRTYVRQVVTPLMHISLRKIKALAVEKGIEQFIILGSVFDFYRDLLQPEFPDIDIKKLEISRYNIRFISYKYYSNKEFSRLFHTESFLKYYFPHHFNHSNTSYRNVLEKLKHIEQVIEQEQETLKKESENIEQEFNQQLQNLDIGHKKTLIIDFGYQGTFCELMENLSILNDDLTHFFLTVKEANKFNCHTGVTIPSLKLPTKDFRDPFWILDTEIILKKASKTPLAGTGYHQNSTGWPEMYEYLIECVKQHRSPRSIYQQEQQVTGLILKHIVSIDRHYLESFNWLCRKVHYNKYSIAANESTMINKMDGFVQIDIDEIAKFEKKTYGEVFIDSSFDIDTALSNKKHPFYHYYCYLNSSRWIHKNLSKGNNHHDSNLINPR
ncbi:hypothetical protein [Gynuella sunshinyii]|uniref:Putative hydrolase (HAD superfamily) n=1 Tax=Gynuella sunshinyii YC6258 TaxID=1445510 RepID=A0A0C5VKD1_9GAMM|nr:hypothetical protein [Gynuella sunshinyii]AJQ93843.1 putative hydrolase (HAD superfamily) [Gynuella sunshinyii YC6258]